MIKDVSRMLYCSLMIIIYLIIVWLSWHGNPPKYNYHITRSVRSSIGSSVSSVDDIINNNTFFSFVPFVQEFTRQTCKQPLKCWIMLKRCNICFSSKTKLKWLNQSDYIHGWGDAREKSTVALRVKTQQHVRKHNNISDYGKGWETILGCFCVIWHVDFLAQMLFCLDSQCHCRNPPNPPFCETVQAINQGHNPALYFHAQLKLFLSVCERHIWNPPMSHLLVFWSSGHPPPKPLE